MNILAWIAIAKEYTTELHVDECITYLYDTLSIIIFQSQ